jgi:hypothetical protein
MQTVCVKRAILAEKVTSARNEHIDELAVARKNWREQSLKDIDAFRDRVDRYDVLTGKFETPSESRDKMVMFDGPPQDMTSKYDRVLRMLELETREDIELTDREYAQYVENDWEWSRTWKISNSKYLG